MIEHNNFSELLRQEIKELENLQQKLSAELDFAPKGSLHILQKKGKQPEYYVYESRSKRKYLSKKEIVKASALAQKDYNSKLIKDVEKRIKIGKMLLDSYQTPLARTYDSMVDAKKQLVLPYELDDLKYVSSWYEQYPGNKNSYPISSNI